MNQKNKLTPEELHARLIVTIGIILAIVFAGSVFALLYALLFITQPLGEQAPNDAAFIDLVSTLCVLLSFDKPQPYILHVRKHQMDYCHQQHTSIRILIQITIQDLV